ncbi:GNAT family N-acetyltransferase [Chitinispirillales bacterium ANBcel5]|uniref:GNAT family N-acetyltransferase n=1 Tax=Cellulosispirillum alkaliphilum TaxID=3039283 RepID=UPI002A505C31|nr:GNAT family N-acetyltransferase [Chitinispirillales bacterium ANBcel5]
MMVRLRDACREDYEFLYDLLKSTMMHYYSEAFGDWDETLERQYFDESFSRHKYQIIIYDNCDIGCISLTQSNKALFINELQIVPQYQNRSIGKQVMKSVIEDSNRLSVPITLEVLKTNNRAEAFYSRLGFKRNGQTESHWLMYRGACGK